MTDLAERAELGVEITPDYARGRLAELRAKSDLEGRDFNQTYYQGMHEYVRKRDERPLPEKALFWVEVQALDRAIEGDHDQFPAPPVFLNLAQYMIDPAFESVPEEAS